MKSENVLAISRREEQFTVSHQYSPFICNNQNLLGMGLADWRQFLFYRASTPLELESREASSVAIRFLQKGRRIVAATLKEIELHSGTATNDNIFYTVCGPTAKPAVG